MYHALTTINSLSCVGPQAQLIAFVFSLPTLLDLRHTATTLKPPP